MSPSHQRTAGIDVRETAGFVPHSGWLYDAANQLIDLVSRGKLRALRRRTLDVAQLRRGETILDVGCGTGTLALEAYERVGEAGRVVGMDSDPKQIARARSKAGRKHAAIDFRIGSMDRLEFPDQTFDVVLSTMMMHHLSDDAKRRGLAEIARALSPGGRLVVVDTEHPGGPYRGHGLGSLGIKDIPALMQETGLSLDEQMDIRLPRLPCHATSAAAILVARKAPRQEPPH
jgi:ubiquinone/menaquinone biosynthesis C-methylase UbiE